MIIRNIKKSHWDHIYSHIIEYGRGASQSLQFDIDINCNGTDYILKVQPDKKRRIFALQAVGIYPDDKDIKNKTYRLINDNIIISALLEIIIYQGANKRT